MNAAGSDRATIYGWSEGGQMSLMLAATQPERVSGLVLYGTYASIQAPPYSVPPERFELFLGALERHWGEGILVRLNAPSRVKDKAFVEWFGRLERAVTSPSGILALLRANYEIDVTDLLPSIRVPTLILHRAGDVLVPIEAGRDLACNIPGARFVELPGGDHLLQAFDQDVLDLLLDHIEEFITGRRPRPAPQHGLATAISADIVGSAKPPPLAPAGAEFDAIAELERCREILASGEVGAGLAGLVARAEAVVAAARGSWSESEALFIKAAETFRRYGMVWQEAQTFQTWAHALRAGADRRASIEKLDMAIEIYRRHAAGRNAGEGEVARANGGTGASAHAPRGTFRREGDYWTLSWQHHVVHVKNAKGLHYIAYLLAKPGRQVLACELAAAGTATGDPQASTDPGATAVDLGDAGGLLDAKARGQYGRRMDDLGAELADAVQLNDVGRAAHLRSELEALRDQIVAAVGLGGRDRRAASHAERARLMVTKAIKAAIAKVRASDAALGRHLATSIKTGHCCTYDSGPVPPVSWQV